MIEARIPTELVELARTVTDKLSAEIHDGGSLAYAQLVASELYEELQLELKETPSSDPATRGMLAAAIDQCRRSVDATLSMSLRIAELKATLDLLENGTAIRPWSGIRAPATRPAPKFRVIEGGLSKTPERPVIAGRTFRAT